MVIRDPVLLSEEAHLDASDGRLVGLADHRASCGDSCWPCGGFPDDVDDRLEGSVDHAGVPDPLDEARLCPAGDLDGPSGYPVCCEGGRGAHYLTREDLHDDPAYCAASRATGVAVPGLPY